MKLPVQITFKGMDASPALEASARERVARLERFGAGIMGCRVAVEVLQKHSQQGRPIGVRIELTIPGRQLVVDRVEHEDAHVALREAFDGMKRQLQDASRQRRDQEKQHPRPLQAQATRPEP
jgi:ribosomal subunit interface protein